MNTNLLDFVLSRLDTREPPWTEVARQTGVPYDTLKKIARRTTPNPGVKHVQALADFFAAQPALADLPDAGPPGAQLALSGLSEQGVTHG